MFKRPAPAGKVRLQRVLADAGVAARRVAERLIEQGHVRVNGETVQKLPAFVNPHEDHIEVDGRTIAKPERQLYVMVNKPAGTIVSTADEPDMGRTTVADLVDHPAKARLFPVGRLDFESTGLVVMTNDGDLAHLLTHPRYQIPKTYHVIVKGGIDQAAVEDVITKFRAMRKRAAAEERRATGPVPIGPAPDITILRQEAERTLLEITLTEAKNRELRDVFKDLGMPIKKLTRVALGPLQLKGLAIGQWRELTRPEVAMLRSATRGGKTEPQGNIRAHMAKNTRRKPKQGATRAQRRDAQSQAQDAAAAAPRAPDRDIIGGAPRRGSFTRSNQPDFTPRPPKPERGFIPVSTERSTPKGKPSRPTQPIVKKAPEPLGRVRPRVIGGAPDAPARSPNPTSSNAAKKPPKPASRPQNDAKRPQNRTPNPTRGETRNRPPSENTYRPGGRKATNPDSPNRSATSRNADRRTSPGSRKPGPSRGGGASNRRRNKDRS